MKTELIIDGNAVYEIDLECRKKRLEGENIEKNREGEALELMGGQSSSCHRQLLFGVMLVYALYDLWK